VVPAGPYSSLVLRPEHTKPVLFGQSILVEVLGKRGDVQVLVVDQRIKMALRGGSADLSALGKVEFVTQGRFRYTAPPREAGVKRGTTVRLEARLERFPDIKGALAVTLGRKVERRPGPDTPPPDKPGTEKPEPEPEKPAEETPPATDPQKEGVVWPSGNVRVATWRARAATDQDFPKSTRKLPKSGGEFLARQDVQKIRVVLLRKDIKKAEMVWYVGNKDGATVHKIAPSKEGPFRTSYNKANQQVFHIEVTLPPDAKKAVHVELVLHTTDRQKIREPFVFRRGRDKDRDGKRDRK